MLGVSRKTLAYSFLIWSVVAVFTSTQLYLRTWHEGGGNTWWAFLKIQLLVWWLWGLLSPLIFWLGRNFRFDKNTFWRGLAVHLPASLVIVGTYLAAYSLIWNVDQGEVNAVAFSGLFTVLFLNLFHWHFFIYMGIIGFVHAQLYFEELKEKEVKGLILEKELLASHLNFLKTQIQPHFLFNTLNGIVSSIRQGKSQTASDMTTELSELLRISLNSSEKQFTTLEQELHYVKTYLAIEKHRFKNLEVTYDIEDRLLNSEIPHFLLQPIVENAIKHGISKKSEAKQIKIRVGISDENLMIEIFNEGPAFKERKEGIGLSNVKRRMASLYGQLARFKIMGSQQGTMVQIQLPLV